jgi:hypothetical protein
MKRRDYWRRQLQGRLPVRPDRTKLIDDMGAEIQ